MEKGFQLLIILSNVLCRKLPLTFKLVEDRWIKFQPVANCDRLNDNADKIGFCVDAQNQLVASCHQLDLRGVIERHKKRLLRVSEAAFCKSVLLNCYHPTV